MLKAWRAYKALNEEQKQIIEQKQVRLVRPIDEMIALLKPIGDMDKLVTSGCQVGCIMFIVVAAAIGSQIGAESINAPGWLRVVTLLILAVLFFFPLVMYLKTRKIDVSDNLRGAVLPMLYVLRDDFDPNEGLELTLDLRQPMAKEKLLREDKPRDRMTETFYNDAWMSAEGVLVDGSRLRWSVVDVIRHRSVTKKTSSGKWKTKTKDSKKCNIDAELTVRNKAYEVSGAADTGEKKTTLTASKTIKLAGVTATDPKVILEVIAELFQRVQPAK